MSMLEKLKDLGPVFRLTRNVSLGAQDLVEHLESARYTGSSDDGLVSCVLDGYQAPISVQISPDALNSELPELVLSSMQDAYLKSKKANKLDIEKIVSPMGINVDDYL